MNNNPLGNFCSPLPKLHPRQSEVRTCSDNERREPRGKLCGAVKAPASRANERELSGNKSGFMRNYPAKTFLFKGKTPTFVSIDNIVYRVSDSPLNSGKCPPEFDAILVNSETKLVFVASISDVQNLSCLYFVTKSAQ